MIKLQVNESFLDFLSASNIFQRRYNAAKVDESFSVNRLKLGEFVTFDESVSLEEFSTFGSGNVFYSAGAFSSLMSPMALGSSVGRYTCLAVGLKQVGFRHPIESVGMSSAFFSFDREYIHSYFDRYESEYGSVAKERVPTPQPQRQPVIVGNDVWIGANVTLFGGVTIGDGAVIASNSVVTKDVMPYSIVAGVPAIHRKWRFPESLREGLVASSWWDYELGDMYNEGLNFSDPARFLDQFQHKKHSIRKLDIKQVPLLHYSIFGESFDKWLNKNVLVDHQNKVLFVRKELDNFSLVTASPKKAVSDDLLPILVKECVNGNFLYVEKLGYIDINHDYSVVIYKDSYGIQSTKVVYLEDKSKACISLNNKYLSPQITEGYKLKPYIKEWETFLLPLHYRTPEQT